jgi:hypothetical protein
MEKIRLETRGGEFVAHEYITGMNPPPEVILWGQRTFVLHSVANPGMRWDQKEGNPTIYREGLMLPIPAPEFYLKLFRRLK